MNAGKKAGVAPGVDIIVNINPAGTLHFAKDCLHAYELLMLNPPHSGYSPIPYFLLSQAAELALKAFISAKLDQRREERERLARHIGHNLCRALNAARKRGLNEIIEITREDSAALMEVNKIYSKKGETGGFAYFGSASLELIYVLEKRAQLEVHATALHEFARRLCRELDEFVSPGNFMVSRIRDDKTEFQ